MEQCAYSGIVEGIEGGLRLDRYIAEQLKLLNRSQQKTRALDAKLNGRPVKLSRLVKNGDILELGWLPAAPLYLEPENIPLDILYEDSRCVVINKAQGMVVHPGAGNHSATLANAVLWRASLRRRPQTQELPDYRSGIVHRLDKNTSGVIIAAYDDETLAFLAAQFKARTVRKQYLALVQGTPEEDEGRIVTRLVRDPAKRTCFTAIPDGPERNAKGKIAVTSYRVLRSWNSYSLVLLKPKTGRTHQLRVHLKYLGHPIVGDPVYNPRYQTYTERPAREKRFPEASLMLHAASLAIVIPGESTRRLFKAPLPDRFAVIIGALNRRKE